MASGKKGSGEEDNPKQRSGRGFFSMDPERQREIASQRVVPDGEAADEDSADENDARDEAPAPRPRRQDADPGGSPAGGKR